MSELPEGWAAATLGDIGRWSSGGTPKKGKVEYYGGDIPWVRTGDLKDGEIFDVAGRITPEGLANSSAKEFPAGTLLVAMYGATIGRTGLLRMQATTNQACAALLPDSVTADMMPFLWWFFRHKVEDFRSAGQGGAQPNISQTVIKASGIDLPPLPEQRRIVAKVDRLSARSAAARDHLAHITTLATRAKQAILDAETVQGTADCETASVADLAAKMFDGPFGSNLKSNDYTDAGVRVVRLENIGVMDFRSDKITHVSKEKFEALQRHSLQPDDLVFSSFVADDVRAALIPTDLGPAINKADCFCIRSDRDIIDPTYLLYRLSARQTYWDMEKLVHGATRPRIGLRHLKAYEIALPSIDRQKDIVRRIKAAFARIDRLTEEAARAAHLVDRLDERLLAKAFAGELVPQDPNDEPAEALLARIRKARAVAPKPSRGRKKKASA